MSKRSARRGNKCRRPSSPSPSSSRLLIDVLEQRLLMSAVLYPVTSTTVDPSDGLRLSVNDEQSSNILGDTAKSGSFSSWSVTGASSTSTTNGLSATAQAAGTPVTEAVSNIATTATPLEYAYYDYVQVSLTLPTNYSGGPITFYYGTNDPLSTSPSQRGITTTNADRQFTIPASQVQGGTHVYRINVGKLVFWEGYLTDLEVSIPTTAAGQVETLNYAEVGDLPNSTLPTSPTTQSNGGSGLLSWPTTANGSTSYNISPTDGTWHAVTSKHFVYYYDTAANAGGYANQAQAAHNSLEITEQAQRIYTQVLGFNNVFGWAKAVNGDTHQYKLNITSWYPGSFSGGYWLNVDSGQTEDTTTSAGYTDPEEPFASDAHEFGHVTDSQNGNYLAGGHFESHANWYREQWINWYADKWALQGDGVSSYNPIANEFSNLHVDNARLIYNDWRVYTPLQYYAASMGLDPNLVAKLWSQGGTNLTIFNKLSNLLSTTTNTNNLNVKDVAARLMAYWPTLDFPSRADMMTSVDSAINGVTGQQALADFYYLETTYLEPDADDTGWYTVPAERAPESYAYTTHVLVPNSGSSSVSVALKGLPSNDSGADWRYVLEDVSNYGTTNATVNSYSTDFANGATGTISVASPTDVVLLVVTATPNNNVLDLNSFDNTARSTQAPTRLTYPYEVQISGATPATGTAERINYTRSTSGAYHVNPDGTTGGWVDSTATVAATAYVAPGAEVLGQASVTGNARILDYAVVADTVQISGNAIISGYAVVNGNATVTGNARVEDHAMVSSGSTVLGSATIEQYALMPAYIGTSATVTDNAVVDGVATPWGGETLSGSAIVDYDFTSYWNLSSGANANNHPYDNFSTYYDQTQVTPSGLIASYRINEPSTTSSTLNDEFGTLNAELRGTPTRVFDATRNSEVLSLNGTNQYAVLDRSLGAMQGGSYSMWVDPTSSTANQPLLYFGSSSNTYLKLVARDANGRAQLTISVNGVVETLESTVAVPLNTWTNIALTFTPAGVATFYINGVAAGTTGSTGTLFTPSAVATDTFINPFAAYLGRDASGNYFTGYLDDIRFYNLPIAPAEVTTEVGRSGAVLGTFATTAPVTFDGSTTTAQSGVHDGLTRTLSAWINPTNASANEGTYYQPIIDSTDERQSSGFGSGVGMNNGKYYVRLDGTSTTGTMWNTGVAVTSSQWQLVTVTFNGTTANFYLNGALRATKAYSASASYIAGKNYRIGFGLQTTSSSNVYFQGQIFDAVISDLVVPPTDITLPPGFSSANSATNSGSTAFGNGTFVVNGGGSSGIASMSDTDYFTYSALNGDGQINALVASPVAVGTGTVNSAATSGIALRTDSTATAVNAYLSVTPGGTVSFTYRSSIAATTTTTNGSTGTATVAAGSAVYLRLVRSGNNVSAYYSTNGTTYTPVGSTVTLNNLANSAVAGMAVSSHSNSALAQGVFSQVSIVTTTAPTISTPTISNVTPTTANLSALGSDPAGESTLTYRWATVGSVPAPVTFSANATNAAKNTVVTFYAPGSYTFQVSAYDTNGLIVNSSTVSISVASVAASVAPANTTLISGATQQFSITDQFGNAYAGSGVSWAASTGAISSTGLYTASLTGGAVTVTATLNGGSASTALTVVAPLLYYRNDSITSTSGKQVVDSSGNGYTGAINAGTTYGTNYSSTGGEIGPALQLNGNSGNDVFADSNAYVTLPSSFSTAFSKVTDFTISGWVKETSANTWARLFDFGNSSSSQFMFLAPDAGGGGVQFSMAAGGGSSGQTVYASTTLTVGTWNFIAVTLAGTTATIYVNGAAAASGTITLNPASLGVLAHNYLGKSQFGDPYLQGAIDDFRIYGTAAPASAIQSLYNTGLATMGGQPSITTAAAANPSPVTGTTTTLTVSATETAGSSGPLIYTWAATTVPSGKTVSFDTRNGTTTGNTTVAAFSGPGNYTFTVTVADGNGTTATSSVNVLVKQATAVTLSQNGSTTSNATQPLSFTAGGLTGVPNGETVTLKDASNGNAVVATGTLSGGSATFTVPAGTLLAGTHNLFAVYAGDSSFAASQSSVVTQTVQVVVTGVVVNGNNAALAGSQRSMVNSIVYTFSEAVKVGAGAFAISVHASSPGTAPTLAWTAINAGADGSSTQWVLTFSGSSVIGGSIADGVYDLTMNASAITSDANPAVASQSRATDTFYRLFGDADGDHRVTSADYNAFLSTYNLRYGQAGYIAAFDATGTNARITAADYNAFLAEYGNRLSGFTPTI